MTAKTTAAGVPYDVQGDMSDVDRRHAAMHGFIHEFGAVAAAHLETCVRCGMCADACHFYVATKNPAYTPIYKLRPFEQAYHRHAGPFAPIYRLLGIAPKVTIAELEEWERLVYDACTLCGRCTLACPMGIDIAELVKEARHGLYKAGLTPDRLQLMDRTARAWTSPATPAEDFADIIRETGEQFGVEMHVDLGKADYLVTVAPAELTDHTKALADIAKILNRIGASWTYHSEGFEASNIGFINGDTELQKTMTIRLIDTAKKIGAHTVILPECGHALRRDALGGGTLVRRQIADAHPAHDRIPAGDGRGGKGEAEADRTDSVLSRPLPAGAPRRRRQSAARRPQGARDRAQGVGEPRQSRLVLRRRRGGRIQHAGRSDPLQGVPTETA